MTKNLKFIRNEIGMTLIEIMIVLIIVTGLAATIGKTVFTQFAKSQVQQTQLMFKETAKQLELYNADCGSYPTTDQGLQALVQDPGKDACSNWGPVQYLKAIPKDAWQKPVIYESDGGKFVLRSLGRDKKEGGSGADKDLSSEE